MTLLFTGGSRSCLDDELGGAKSCVDKDKGLLSLDAEYRCIDSIVVVDVALLLE